METENNKKKFKGFYVPNSTQVPDTLFDELLSELSGAELKVVLYIIRRTFGFKKAQDNISLAQMVDGIVTKEGKVLDRGTGLGKASVARAVITLEERGVIVRNRRQSQERGDEATTYSLKLQPLSQNEAPASNPPVSHFETPPGTILRHPPVSKWDTQDTVKQYTDTNVNVAKEEGGEVGREEPKTDLRMLPDLDQPRELTNSIASEILAVFGDPNSTPFYTLVAAKIPESFIRQKLSELKQGNSRSPARVFVSIVKTYAAEKIARQKLQGIALAKEGLFRIGNSRLQT
jgi:Bacteriophage replication protein O